MLISLLLEFPLKTIARKLGLYAKENERTVHHGQIPRVGGIAIYIAFIVGVLLFIKDSITVRAFRNDDIALAETVEPLEQVIDVLTQDIKSRHINRLTKGECTIELGFILMDTLTNFERISDHCSNIAVAVIEAQRDAFDAHQYISSVKNDASGKFGECYDRYLKHYSL
jgi:phosphate uptake regulator